MENKLNLDPQTILDKEFHVDFKGYSPAEVDEFLDSVIQDIRSTNARSANWVKS